MQHPYGRMSLESRAGDEPALRLERPVPHRAELLEDLDHAQELLPVGAA